MEPIFMVSVVSTYFRIISSLTTVSSNAPDWVTIHSVLSEVKILNAIMLESTATISELGGAAPQSADIALQQCQETGDQLLTLVEKLRTMKLSGSVRRAVQMAFFWEVRQARIVSLLNSFRTSCHLLRQIAADAMTHTLLQRQHRQILYIDDMLGHKWETGDARQPGRCDGGTDEADYLEVVTGIHHDEPQLPGRQRTVDVDQRSMRRRLEDFDPYLQQGTICLPSTGVSPHATWYPVKINLDTGSLYNIVSRFALDDIGFDGPFEMLKAVKGYTVKFISTGAKRDAKVDV